LAAAVAALATSARQATMVVQVDQVAVQEIQQVVEAQTIREVQAQLDKEILELQQILEQVADSMLAVAVALVLQEKLEHYKDMVVTVMYG
jgi:tRNA(Ser,Leu) C12 N-acetylase TAN1